MDNYKKYSRLFSRFAITRAIGLACYDNSRLSLTDISRSTGITVPNLSNACSGKSSLSTDSVMRFCVFFEERFGSMELLRLMKDFWLHKDDE